MRYYEWELYYLDKLINAKRKAISKHDEAKSRFTHMRMERELEALQRILKVVSAEAKHLEDRLGDKL